MIASQNRHYRHPRLCRAKFVIYFMAVLAIFTTYFIGSAEAQAPKLEKRFSQSGVGAGQLTIPYSLDPVSPIPAVLAQPKPLTTLVPNKLLTSKPKPLGLQTSTSLTHARVNVEELKKIGPDSVGTLSVDQGGFGNNMWQGTSRREVERLLPKLPVGSKSKTMRNLMRRLLLSSAKAPEGEPLNPNSRDLIGTRVKLLVSMGDIPAAMELIKKVPTAAHSQRLLRSEVDSLFMRNDNARVCSLVASQIRDLDTAYWQKAFIFCQSLAGEIDKASLGASLLRETGDNDQVFHGLLNQISGLEKYHIASLIDPDPLYFAMVRAAKAELPADVTSSNNPAILRTIATSPNARPELRLDAAERAEAMGALNTQVLRQLYAGVAFSENALEHPLTKADSERSPLGRALLYRKALLEGVPTATAEVLSKAFKLARESQRYQSMARVYLPILKGIAPNRDFVWFIPEAIRALLAAGDLQSATPWFAMLSSSSAINEEAARIQNEIRPLARLAGALEGDDWQPNMLADWWVGVSGRDEEDSDAISELARNKAILIYSLLDGLGDKVPNAQWEALMNGPLHVPTVMPQPALWRSLESAASNSRVGETVLLSLLALGHTGPVNANPIVLRKVLISILKIGLEKEARALALEAAIASGL